MRRSRHSRNKGVSEIVGALALIIVVIIAVAALAYFISATQKQEIDRQSQLSYVQNERLDIVSLEPSGNDTHWEAIKVTVRNPNVQDSAVYRIAFNDLYAKNWTDGSGNYSFDTAPLRIPQGETRSVSVNLTDGLVNGGPISRYGGLKVTVMTPAANFFTRLFPAPVAVMEVGVETYRYGVGERDILVLDGSGSLSDSFIQNYSWRIDVPKDYQTVNWSDPTSFETRYATGGVFGYTPEALFDMVEVSSLNVTGPIRVALTVTDSYGILANSTPVIMPRNTRIVPPSYLTIGAPVLNGDESTVVITLFDIFNRPVNGTLLLFSLVDSRNVTSLNPAVGGTASGSVTLTIKWLDALEPGYALVQIRSGQLEPVEFMVAKT